MRILLISSSARGHAIADGHKQSSKNPAFISVFSSANPGIQELAEEQHVLTPLTNIDAILTIAKNTKPNLAVIGPEDPIASGIANTREEVGIPTVAPLKSLAQIESSKGFTRNIIKKYGINCSPQFRVYTKDTMKNMNKFIEQELKENFVVKYDALKGGKGVKVSGEHFNSIDDGVTYAKQCIEECGQVVIEEKLIGCEFSLMSFVSGTQVIDMPAVQDHKRAYAEDTGPNTGGMGTYSDANHSLPFLEKDDLERAKEINRLVAKALLKESGKPYRGILYGGFMATADGVKLIEYNCRFGDPEALNVLPILSSDFVAICEGIVNGELSEKLVQFEHKATVCKYIVPKGYPENKDQKGMEVVFPKPTKNARIYLGDVSSLDTILLRNITRDDIYILGSSRTAGIVGIGDTLEEAEQIAQRLCKQVKGPVRFRSDIGTRDLTTKRVSLLRNLRS